MLPESSMLPIVITHSVIISPFGMVNVYRKYADEVVDVNSP